jgi:hypothetical protein
MLVPMTPRVAIVLCTKRRQKILRRMFAAIAVAGIPRFGGTPLS